jgi:hypothetical protein
MNSEIIKEAIEKANEGIINLGTANGWNQKTRDQYRALQEFKVANSGTSRNLGRCYNEYGFDVLIEGQTYKVIHKVDSGD